ncbi:MAG TPA: hypothetical protein VGQ62_10120 [Chloroflexota bacterium]|nr:hypothetical protein [Chloroflexota bacterium]
MRLRFDDRELTLLRAAEQVRGATLAHSPRPDQLRTALNLAKAGHKVSQAGAGSSISLDEPELNLLLEAVRHAVDEVQWAARIGDADDARRRNAVLTRFPELVEHAWRTFGLARELEALAGRLHSALTS